MNRSILNGSFGVKFLHWCFSRFRLPWPRGRCSRSASTDQSATSGHLPKFQRYEIQPIQILVWLNLFQSLQLDVFIPVYPLLGVQFRHGVQLPSLVPKNKGSLHCRHCRLAAYWSQKRFRSFQRQSGTLSEPDVVWCPNIDGFFVYCNIYLVILTM